MLPSNDRFRQTVLRQIALNQSRTPTERFLALCDLLGAARAMAPEDPAACERRLRAKSLSDSERERSRAEFRRLLANAQASSAQGI
jgi:hypothetical protein